MVVDDDRVALNCLSRLLIRDFPLASIVAFADPAKALVRLRKDPCDVVLTDFNMPGINGINLLRAAREGGSDASFIVMTGDATDQILTDGLRLGLFGLLSKPFSRTTITPLVQQAIECHQLRQEVAALRQRLAEAGLEYDWLHCACGVSDEDSQPLLPF